MFQKTRFNSLCIISVFYKTYSLHATAMYSVHIVPLSKIGRRLGCQRCTKLGELCAAPVVPRRSQPQHHLMEPHKHHCFCLPTTGKKDKQGQRVDIWTNFRDYNLPAPLGLLRADAHHLPFRSNLEGSFDCIVCDPPYGVRAGRISTLVQRMPFT